MSITHLSSKGQVIIPKAIREAHQWRAGQVFEVIETPEGLLLRDPRPFPATKLDDVAGCLPYTGPTISIEAMDQAIGSGLSEQNDRR